MTRPDPQATNPLAGQARAAIDQRDGPGTAERRDRQADAERAYDAAVRELLATMRGMEFYPSTVLPEVGLTVFPSAVQATDFNRLRVFVETIAKRRAGQ